MNIKEIETKYGNIEAICLQDGTVINAEQVTSIEYDETLEVIVVKKPERHHIEGQVISETVKTVIYPASLVVAVRV